MDKDLLLWINQEWANSLLDLLFDWLSSAPGFGIPLLILLSLFLGFRYGIAGWKTAGLMLLVTAFSDQIANLLKDSFQQARPCFELYSEIRRLDVGDPRCMSSADGMPSSHAMNFFTALSFLALSLNQFRWSIVLITIAVLVTISRVYLGVHFPSQAASGALFGLILGSLFALIVHRRLEKLNKE